MITYKPVTDYSKGIGQLNTGLGNQMFQIASTIGIAIKNGQEWALPEWVHPFVGPFHITQEEYELKKIPWGYYDIKVKGNVSMQGYMQSEKYFKHCEDLIRDLFTFREKGSPRTDFIAVHVRRGDYLNKSDYHTMLRPNYYMMGINTLPNLPVVLFTDGLEGVFTQVPKQYVDEVYEGTPFESLEMMTKAKYHVIGNSSFSWWGAWLADSECVVAPRDWFEPKKKPLSTEDIYCENWIVI